MIDPGLDGKVVLVTGGNNPYGIGAATAKAFAAQNAKVFIHYFRPPNSAMITAGQSVPGEDFYHVQQTKSAGEIVRMIRESGGIAAAWEADLSEPTAPAQLFDRAENVLGPVQVLVNNAALTEQDTFIPQSQLDPDGRAVDGFPMHSFTVGSHDRHFAVNSRAAALMMAEFVDRHVKRGIIGDELSM